MAELTQAETDIDTMCNKLDGVTKKWRQAQLKEIAEFKKKATAVEKKISSQDVKLQALLDNDITMGTLITKLTQENPDLLPKPHSLPRQDRYNFAERCVVLEQNFSEAIRSQDFVKSKLLTQSVSPDIKPKLGVPVTDRLITQDQPDLRKVDYVMFLPYKVYKHHLYFD